MSLFSIENEVFASLAKYGGILIGKTLVMALLTARQRFAHKSFMAPEDVTNLANNPETAKKFLVPNKEVERVRSAHLNDIENIVPFMLLALLYIGTNPNPTTATWLFKVFTGCRILHTIVYLGKVPQPARVLCYSGGLGTTLYMLYETLKSVW